MKNKLVFFGFLMLALAGILMTQTTRNGVAYWTTYTDILKIAAPSNPASGDIRLYANSTSGNLACLTSSGASCLPAAGTITDNVWIPMAFSLDGNGGRISSGAFGSSGAPSSISATSVASIGYTEQFFVDAADTYAYFMYRTHDTWTATLTVEIEGRSGSAAANNATLSVSTWCPAIGVELNPSSFNTATTGEMALSGTSPQRATPLVLSSIDVTGCVGGELMFLKVGRVGTGGSDNYAGTMALLGFTLKVTHN